MIIVCACAVALLAADSPPGAGRAIVMVALVSLSLPFLIHRLNAVFCALPALIAPPELGKFFAYELGLFALLAILILDRRRDPQTSRAFRAWDPVEIAFCAWLAWAALSVTWSKELPWWGFGIRKLVIAGVALFTARRFARHTKPGDLDVGITLTALAIAGVTLIRAVANGAAPGGSGFSRTDATDVGWGTSNYIAALLALCAPTALHVAMHHRRAWARLLGGFVLPFTAIVVALAASRGGALLIVGASAYTLFRTRTNYGVWIWLGFAAALALLMLGPGGQELVGRFASVRDFGSVVVRLMLYRAGWRRLLAAWPIGLGSGQAFITPDTLGATDAHNYWLMIGGELGLVGLILWATLLVTTWRRISQIGREPGSETHAHALRVTFVIAQLNCLFEPTFSGLQYQFLFFWIVGAFLGQAGTRAAARTLTSAAPGLLERDPGASAGEGEERRGDSRQELPRT